MFVQFQPLCAAELSLVELFFFFFFLNFFASSPDLEPSTAVFVLFVSHVVMSCLTRGKKEKGKTEIASPARTIFSDDGSRMTD